jgi:hypothetical protein
VHREICDFALECVANSLEAGASRVRLAIEEAQGRFAVVVQDDGRGMSPEELAAARDPFFTARDKHPGRRAGLGLAFLAQAVEIAGGNLGLESTAGRGTTVRFAFDLANVDTPPAGDVAALLLHSLCFDGDYELEAQRRRNGLGYELRRSELRDALGGIETAGDLLSLREYLRGCEDEVGAPHGADPQRPPTAATEGKR